MAGVPGVSRTPEAVRARYDKAMQLIAGGMPRVKAYLEAQIGPDTVTKIKKGKHPASMLGPEGVKATPRKTILRKKPKFVDLAPVIETESGDEVAVVFCKPNQLKDILGGRK